MVASGSEIFIHNRNVLNKEDALWVEILRRLPAKTLGRFRCVCKWWHSLICSPFFITSHHLTSKSNYGTFGTSYLVSTTCFSNISLSYAVYNPRVSLAVKQPRFLHIPFETSSRRSLKKFIVVDVSGGVVCLIPPHLPESIILWNPTICKFLEIPFPRTLPSSHVLGFGCGFHGELKVVRLWGFFPNSGFGAGGEKYQRYRVRHREEPLQPPLLEVFSTREGHWRKGFGMIEPCALLSYCGCFMNGSVHWIATAYAKNSYDDYRLLLLTFECGSEEFKTMELPREFSRCLAVLPRLFKFRGLLSMLTTTDHKVYKLWSMEEYGVPSSWKEVSLTDQEDIAMMMDYGAHQFQGVDGGLAQDVLPWKEPKINELRVKEPLMGHLLDETLLLMDAPNTH